MALHETTGSGDNRVRRQQGQVLQSHLCRVALQNLTLIPPDPRRDLSPRRLIWHMIAFPPAKGFVAQIIFLTRITPKAPSHGSSPQPTQAFSGGVRWKAIVGKR